MRDAPLRYNILEKQALAFIRALKDFRIYILHSHIVAYVPSMAVKDILTQPDPDGKREKWIAILLECDLEIKHTKIIKGQGLEKLMAQSEVDELQVNLLDAEKVPIRNEKDVCNDFLASPWYRDIIYVLNNLQAPSHLSKSKARSIKLKSARYCIIDGYLYWKDPGGILLNCLLETETQEKIEEFHNKDCGGHLFWKKIAYKILRDGFYWPTLFSDVYKAISTYHECQVFEGKNKLKPLPLIPVLVEAPFQQWGLDFIGEIHPISSG